MFLFKKDSYFSEIGAETSSVIFENTKFLSKESMFTLKSTYIYKFDRFPLIFDGAGSLHFSGRCYRRFCACHMLSRVGGVCVAT